MISIADSHVKKLGGSFQLNKPGLRRFHKFDSDGFITSNDISHGYIPSPCENIHPVPPTLTRPKSEALEKSQRLTTACCFEDQYMTSNNFYHGKKFYNECRDEQPKYPKAPGIDNVFLVKGDTHRYMQGWRNGSNYPRGTIRHYTRYPPKISETKEKFPAKWHDLSSTYGPPTLFTEKRDVFTRPITLLHPTYDAEDHHHPMYKVNPYLTTSKLYHRDFENDLYRLQHIKATDKAGHTPLSQDVKIKYRVRPMEDPFENKSLYLKGRMPNQDLDREANGALGDFANRKIYFNAVAYAGMPPRTFRPKNFLCNESTYQGSYLKPYHNMSVLNHHRPFNVDYSQVKMLAPDVFKTPGMYISENKTYGSGMNVAKIQGNLPLK